MRSQSRHAVEIVTIVLAALMLTPTGFVFAADIIEVPFTFHFRDRRSPNTAGLATGDLLSFGPMSSRMPGQGTMAVSEPLS